MFVQIIEMTAPFGELERLRRLVADEYLPSLYDRPGFLSAHLLEQVDNRDNTKLVIYWESHAALENAARTGTGVLAGSTTSIAARIPGLRVQRQSYVSRISIEPAAT